MPWQGILEKWRYKLLDVVQVDGEPLNVYLTERRKGIAFHVPSIFTFILKFPVIHIYRAQGQISVNVTVPNLVSTGMIPFGGKKCHQVMQGCIEHPGDGPIPKGINEHGNKAFVVACLGQMFFFRSHKTESPLTFSVRLPRRR
jgi:hypothetical protein